MAKSIEEVKKEFFDKGITVKDWAKEHGFNPDIVYKIFHNNRVPIRGISHKIAVKLGIKDAPKEEDHTNKNQE